ncbi:hypothetical protein [Aquimarina sp. BL5]|uniref:hypothetical protein n=1 Tax=Aquimarina sp. BL5 TaxID=1714860 RepID=UPI0011C3F544|nr:hypothetical protein [Aquimarina sp. BL5]
MKSYLIIFLLLVGSMYAQSHKEYPPVIEDFNKDKVLDTLYSFYESGSTFGGTDVKIVNGKTAEVYEFSDYSCYCQMKSVYLVPSILNKPENQPFLSVIQKRLFPVIKKNPDPSLQWIINGYSSNQKLSQNEYFNLIIHPKIHWSTKKIKIPEENYSLILEGDELDIFQNEEDSLSLGDRGKAFLRYCGRCLLYNKPSPELVANTDTYKVYKTSHGIFVEKEGLQKWVLVNDIGLTGSPEKLRWDSIIQVVLIDRYLIVQFSGAPDVFDNIFVTNIETGVVGRLKHVFRRNVKDYGSELVRGDMIRYNDENDEEEASFFVKYEDVFNELENLSKALKN